jgi:hypothetical protein
MAELTGRSRLKVQELVDEVLSLFDGMVELTGHSRLKVQGSRAC